MGKISSYVEHCKPRCHGSILVNGGKVLPPKSYTDMLTPYKFNDGTPLSYAMGLSVAEDSRGTRTMDYKFAPRAVRAVRMLAVNSVRRDKPAWSRE